MKQSVKYLGHIISENGIQTDPDNIAPLHTWPVPTTVKELRQFLGFSGYYRRFIIAKPLTSLLQGNCTRDKQCRFATILIIWNKDAQSGFEKLKEVLSCPPVLAYADYSLPCVVNTDASLNGLGAILYQTQNGQQRPIAFASRGLKPDENNYPAHKLEFLALKWAVSEKFHDYLYGHSFKVQTDNNPLTYIMTTAKLHATGHRWLADLASYDFNIKYRAGRHNIDADSLSRIPRNIHLEAPVVTALCQVHQVDVGSLVESIGMSSSDEHISDNDHGLNMSQENVGISQISTADWIECQKNDEILSPIVEFVQNDTKPDVVPHDIHPLSKRIRHEWDCLHLQNGVLYRKSQQDDQSNYQLFLPLSLRGELLRGLHDDNGHLGFDRVIDLARSRFFWPRMASDVKEYLQRCDRCICRKTSTDKRCAGLVNMTLTYPLELVCMDYLSLEVSKGGYENILVITDHFTRYSVAIPTINQTAQTTARVLYDNFLVHYGFPARLHSDQGRNFESAVIKQLCHITGIKKSRTTSYHAMGNGMVARFNQTLLGMLGTLTSDKKSNWKEYVIPIMALSMRAPVFLLFSSCSVVTLGYKYILC